MDHKLDLTVIQAHQIQVLVVLDPTVPQVVQVEVTPDLHHQMLVAHHQVVVHHLLGQEEEDQDNFNENHIDITYGFCAITN